MRVVVVPPVPALLPAYASLADPVADLRAACLAAVSWLGESVRVVAEDDLGRRVGEALLGSRDGRFAPSSTDEGAGRFTPSSTGDGAERFAPSSGTVSKPDLLVLANGSACRSERAPGHLDVRAHAFDAEVEALLAAGDTAGLARLDLATGRDLLASGLGALVQVSGDGLVVQQAWLDHAEDPFGVMYWVVRWQCES